MIAEPAPPPACAALRTEAPRVSEVPGVEAPEVALVDAGGAVMAPFHEKLARLLRGKATDHVRIAVYGDSNMTMDFISGGMRRLLQGRHGDAGHGFVALGRPWDHYRHMDVKHGPRFGFTSYAVTTHPLYDTAYGFSGIVAESQQGGATAYVGTADEPSPVGRRMGHAGVFYLKGPRYGRFSIKVDGTTLATVDTEAPAITAGYTRVSMPEGPHQVEVVVESARRVRLLGATAESATPGIIVDSLGVGALNTQSQWREDAAVNQAMFRARPYDLVVFMTGTNDILQLDRVPGWLEEIVARHREALPGLPIILASPPDRGQLRSFAPTLEVGKQRRELAAHLGTAFWDLWAAMGGEGSMARFHERGLSTKSDYIHFSKAGGAWVGERLVQAIWRDFMAHLEAHPEAGCP